MCLQVAFFLDGLIVERKYSEALKYHQMTIELADSDSICFYRILLEKCEGVELNYA